MSDNWVVQNLQKSLSTWNDKFAEVWELLTQSPEDFKGELDETSVGFSDKSSGGRKPKIYNLDMILSVGYRVNSKSHKHRPHYSGCNYKSSVLKLCQRN